MGTLDERRFCCAGCRLLSAISFSTFGFVLIWWAWRGIASVFGDDGCAGVYSGNSDGVREYSDADDDAGAFTRGSAWACFCFAVYDVQYGINTDFVICRLLCAVYWF